MTKRKLKSLIGPCSVCKRNAMELNHVLRNDKESYICEICATSGIPCVRINTATRKAYVTRHVLTPVERFTIELNNNQSEINDTLADIQNHMNMLVKHQRARLVIEQAMWRAVMRASR